jgi:hypothetical protein
VEAPNDGGFQFGICVERLRGNPLKYSLRESRDLSKPPSRVRALSTQPTPLIVKINVRRHCKINSAIFGQALDLLTGT